jgi:hypothetical protein
VARMWERRNAYRVLVWKYERKKALESTRSRWKNDIKIEQKYYMGRHRCIILSQDKGNWRSAVRNQCSELGNFLTCFLRRAFAL